MRYICIILMALLCSGCTVSYYTGKYDGVRGRVLAIETGENRVPVADAICAVKQEPNTCKDSQE